MDQLQLSYRSARPISTTDTVIVEEIVLPSMQKNRGLDITGCLWFGPSMFYQVLEGERSRVESLYTRIASDRRHHSVHLVSKHPQPVRFFDRFSMKLVKSEDEVGMLRLLNLLVRPNDDGAAGSNAEPPTRQQRPMIHAVVSHLIGSRSLA